MVDEVWKQQTLLQLLQIVELPMLDCILTSPARVQLQACRAPLATQDLVISNTCLERELPDTLSLPQSVLCLVLSSFFAVDIVESCEMILFLSKITESKRKSG